VDETRLQYELNPEEVSIVKWVEVSTLPDMLASEPSVLCPWFAIYIKRWNELKLGR
jgi:isopentenyldiphosphate isomerase